MIEKHCKTCGTKFLAIKEAQFFCSRKCFKRDYYKRNKAREVALANKRPVYTCGACGHGEEVPFDPVKNYTKFSEYKCPKCKVPRSEVVDKEKKKSLFVIQIEGSDHLLD